VKRPFSLSLRRRLWLVVFLTVVPPFGLILYINFELRRLATFDMQEDVLMLARVAVSEQKRLMEGARHLLMALAHSPEVRSGDATACDALAAQLVQRFPQYTTLGAARPNGEVFCSSVPPPAPVNLADQPDFQRVLHTRDFITTGYLVGSITGKPVLAFAYPSVAESGSLQAVVFIGLDLAWIERVAADTRLPRGSTFTLLDRNGRIVVRFPDSERWTGESLPAASIVRAMQTQSKSVGEFPDLDGITRLFAFDRLVGPSQETDAYLTIGIPKEGALAKVNRIVARSLAGLGLVSVLVFVVARTGRDLFILPPVNDMMKITKRVAAGDLSARTGLPYERGELGQLARAFDEMAAELQVREREAKRAAEALRQSEKQTAMGQMAARIAHEINNPLAGIKYAFLLVKDAIPRNHPDYEYVGRIERELERIAHIVRQMFDLYRPDQESPREVAVDTVIRDVVALLQANCRERHVAIGMDTPAAPVVSLHEGSLRQVLFTMLQNAVEASPPGKRVQISARVADDRLTLAVADRGQGIPEDVRSQVFEPFFTTKRGLPRGGLGLGLSVCKGIVDGMGGSIDFESQPGQGTMFRVILPLNGIRMGVNP